MTVNETKLTLDLFNLSENIGPGDDLREHVAAQQTIETVAAQVLSLANNEAQAGVGFVENYRKADHILEALRQQAIASSHEVEADNLQDLRGRLKEFTTLTTIAPLFNQELAIGRTNITAQAKQEREKLRFIPCEEVYTKTRENSLEVIAQFQNDIEIGGGFCIPLLAVSFTFLGLLALLGTPIILPPVIILGGPAAIMLIAVAVLATHAGISYCKQRKLRKKLIQTNDSYRSWIHSENVAEIIKKIKENRTNPDRKARLINFIGSCQEQGLLTEHEAKDIQSKIYTNWDYRIEEKPLADYFAEREANLDARLECSVSQNHVDSDIVLCQSIKGVEETLRARQQARDWIVPMLDVLVADVTPSIYPPLA